jgi:putative RecB family exonuclease
MIAVASPPKRDYLSYSAVRTFQSCPLKYRFRYIDGLQEDCVSSSLIFGSAIHAAVEFFFQQQLAGEESPTSDRLMEVYRFAWQDRSETEIRFGKTESAESLDELADRMLSAFLESDLSQPAGRIIGVEEELRGELMSGLPDLLGRIDLLLETDDSILVQDFKTSRSAWKAHQAEDQSEQLLLYADLARRLVPGKRLRLQFAVVTKGKTPKCQLLEAKFDQAKLDRTKQVFSHVWSAIQTGHFYPSPSPMQCPGCGYRDRCAAWRGNSDPAGVANG